MKASNIKKEQILKAAQLGKLAFEAGQKRVCAWDLELNKMFIGRNIGETPKGEASSIEIMKAWISAWDSANLSNARSIYFK